MEELKMEINPEGPTPVDALEYEVDATIPDVSRYISMLDEPSVVHEKIRALVVRHRMVREWQALIGTATHARDELLTCIQTLQGAIEALNTPPLAVLAAFGAVREAAPEWQQHKLAVLEGINAMLRVVEAGMIDFEPLIARGRPSDLPIDVLASEVHAVLVEGGMRKDVATDTTKRILEVCGICEKIPASESGIRHARDRVRKALNKN